MGVGREGITLPFGVRFKSQSMEVARLMGLESFICSGGVAGESCLKDKRCSDFKRKV